MVEERDRMARASRYVLGLMDEDERERAERDLEHDPVFLDAMVRVAERMHLFDLNKPHQQAAPALWASITTHLATLPHIKVAAPAEAAQASAPVQAATTAAGPGTGFGWRIMGWRLPLMALSLAAAGGLGYAAGSAGVQSAPAECASAPGQK